MKLLDLTKNLSKYIPINISDGSNLYFYEYDRNLNIKSILKKNIKNNENKVFKLSLQPKIVCFESAVPILFYAIILVEEDRYVLKVNKFNCVTWKDEEVTEFKTNIRSYNNEELLNPLFHSLLYVISETNFILFISDENLSEGYYFKEIILFDSDENKFYDVNPKIKDIDSLKSLQIAWIVNNGEYVVFKTGRVKPCEKIRFWNELIMGEAIKKNFDHDSCESLVTIKIKDFINLVKKKEDIFRNAVIKTIDIDGTFRFLDKYGDIICNKDGNILYILQSFSNNSMKLIEQNLNKNYETYRILKDVYKDLRFYKNNLYAISERMNKVNGDLELLNKKDYKNIDIFDVLNHKKVKTIYDEELAYVDENIIISSSLIKENSKYRFMIQNLRTNEKATFFAKDGMYIAKSDVFLLI